jgi:hypothetical protein
MKLTTTIINEERKYRKLLLKDIAAAEENLAAFDARKKATNVIFNGLICVGKECVFQDGQYTIVLPQKDNYRKGIDKASIMDLLGGVMLSSQIEEITNPFETPNSIGVFAKISGEIAKFTINKNAKKQLSIFVEANEKTEDGISYMKYMKNQENKEIGKNPEKGKNPKVR